MGDGSLQSHSGANPNPKTAKGKGNVPKGGEAGGVALTHIAMRASEGMQWGCPYKNSDKGVCLNQFTVTKLLHQPNIAIEPSTAFQ
jgi:hypothetical protein